MATTENYTVAIKLMVFQFLTPCAQDCGCAQGNLLACRIESLELTSGERGRSNASCEGVE